MDIVLMILYATIVLGFLVFIHEGGHYLAARAFGVRVTEFMLGLPGPSVGFTRALNYLSAAGMLLFLGFFLVMANQDIQRYVFGNWG